MKQKALIVVVFLVAVVIATFLWLTSGDRENRSTDGLESRAKSSKRIPDAGKGVKARGGGTKGARNPFSRNGKSKIAGKAARRKVSVVDNYSPADRKLADAVQAGLDDEDFESTQAAALKALKSSNPEVRVEAVDALGWFGEKALVDLTKVLRDKDSDVVDAARNHLENALMGMEHQDRAFALAASYLELFGDNEDTATMFAGVMTSAGNQIIDPDDADSAKSVAQAKADRAGLVDMISGLLEKGGKCAEQAKEVYESVVGEEWSGREAADKWANDIEEPDSTDDSELDDNVD